MRHFGHVGIEANFLELLTRIAPRLVQLGQDVAQCRLAATLIDVATDLNVLEQIGVADQLAHRHAQVFGHPLDHVVALGMNGRSIKRRLGIFTNPQKARRLLERFRTHPRHVKQLLPRRKRAVLAAIRRDVLRQRLTDTGHVLQELRRRRVYIHADLVHARLDDLIELLLERWLVHVVLILTNPDRLGLDLHQLGERILEPTTNRRRTAHRGVMRRELLTTDLGSRIDRSAGLTDHDDLDARQLARRRQLAHKGFGLTAGSPVADRNGARFVFTNQIFEPLRRFQPS